ncbi:MAG: efflux RND transporter permease subunit [Fibrobacteres bacterium]|nr:efflux RND transporter permease subunit [Fibrobacterota bacterium]
MTKFAVKNPVTILVLAALMLAAGALSYISLPRESFPEIKIPYVFVNTVYPGAAPQDIEKLVTEKIEDKLEGLDGVKKVTSQSMESVSSIQVEFNTDVDVETALRRVKDKVDMAQGDLPDDAEDPMVQELNFSNIPIFIVSLTADYEMDRLEQVADALEDRLSTLPGVLEAKVTGKQDKEIAIDIDPAKLTAYGISLRDVSGAIQAQHRNIPGGSLKAAGNSFSIKLTGEIKDPEEFGEVVVRAEGSKIVRVRDIAAVKFGWSRERSSIARFNGKPSLAITVTKRTGENIIDIVDASKKVVEEQSRSWPQGTIAAYSFDQSIEIREMVDELTNHIITGLFLVIGILTFFLGFRNSFFISTAIPFSMGIGLIVLQMMGITLNMVVLFALVLGLGMLVDDGIVVVENIYRHLSMGKTRFQAAIDGTKEVTLPVATATLTTVSAFIPILWMPGIMGNFMKYLPITVSVTLAGSLFVAFIFNPVFASLFMHNNPDHHDEEGGGLFMRFRAMYGRTLETWLHRPVLLLFLCVMFVVAGITSYAVFGKGVAFFPKTEPEVAAAEIEGPLGLDIYKTDEAIRKIEEAARAIPKSEADIASVSSVVGRGKSDMNFGGSKTEPNKAYIDVKFARFEHREVPSWTTLAWMEKNLPTLLPGWNVKVKEQADGPPQGKPVELLVQGEDFVVLGRYADSVAASLRAIPELTNVTTDYNPAQPEIRVDVNREQAKRFGLGTSEVAMAVRSAMYGMEAGKYRVGNDEYKIMVRLDAATRENFSSLDQITIPHEGAAIPLNSVAKFTQDAGLASINRLNRVRTVQITAELAPNQRDETGPKAAAAAIVDGLKLPDGYAIHPGTSSKDQDDTKAFMFKALLIAMALVFFTMVLQFNSIYQPFLILIGVFLALGGVFWGLLIVQTQLSIIMTGVGIIALAGVVAKNGIVLIDFMNHLRAEGRPIREVAIEGGKTRLRPVMLTAITAMIGLLPMATGMGVDWLHLGLVTKSQTAGMWAPLAWAIFWGLLFNTVLVLVVTPVLYYAYYSRVEKSKLFNWMKPQKASAADGESAFAAASGD